MSGAVAARGRCVVCLNRPSAESDGPQPLFDLRGGLRKRPVHDARVPEGAFVDGPHDGDRGAQIFLDRFQWTLYPAPKPGILVAGPVPRLSRTGPAPLLDAWLEVELEHPGKVRLDTAARGAFAQAVVVGDGLCLANLQLAGNQEQDVGAASGQCPPDLGVLKSQALGDGPG